MTNRVLDGFDWFPSGKSNSIRGDLWGANGWYARFFFEDQYPDVVTGRFDFGKAMSLHATHGAANATQGMVVPVDDFLSEGFIGLACYYPSSNSIDAESQFYVAFYDGVNDQFQCCVVLRNNGVIEVRRGGPDGTILATTPTGAFEENRWFHMEIFGLIADSGGEVEVRINTVQKISVVSSDTRGGTVLTTFDSILLSVDAERTEGFTMYIDDFFMNDTDGTTCNDWMGNLRVKSQFMIGDGYVNDFSIGGTSPAATNWQSVLNQDMNDTKYVYSPNVGDLDMYVPDPNLNAPFVRALQIRMGLRQDDATQRSAKAVIRIGSTDYEDDEEQFTNQLYTFYFGKWELNPATGVSFTGAEVNALEVGVKVES